MAHVHVILNQKGGVGKSTLAVNLAAVTADVLGAGAPDAERPPVVAVSIDPQGSAVWWSERVGEGLPFDFVQAHDDLAGLAALSRIPSAEHVFVDTPGWLDLAFGVPLMDSGRARSELRWAPRSSASEALQELLTGMRDRAGKPTPPLAPDTGGPLRAGEIQSGVGEREGSVR